MARLAFVGCNRPVVVHRFGRLAVGCPGPSPRAGALLVLLLLAAGRAPLPSHGQGETAEQALGRGQSGLISSDSAPSELQPLAPGWMEEDQASSAEDGHPLQYSYGGLDEPGRHVGLGDPLVGTSWLNRPYHADGFVGGLFGDEAVNQRGGVLSGLRLGWDLDHYWGVETRFAYARPNSSGGGARGTVQLFDGHLMYYPWGDAHWRPFASLGSGIARYSFLNDAGQPLSQVIYQLPVGVGIKYFFRKWLALRFEVIDNVGFGAPGDKTVNNLSISGGIEWRFGGPRRSYFPFDPDIHFW